MPTKEHMRAVVESYCRCETEKLKQEWLDLFAPNASHEDPVGYQRNDGIEMLARFWDNFQALDVDLRLTEETIICGNEAIAFMKATVNGPDGKRHESGRIVDQFIFDDAGKIIALRAFYNMGG